MTAMVASAHCGAIDGHALAIKSLNYQSAKRLKKFQPQTPKDAAKFHQIELGTAEEAA